MAAMRALILAHDHVSPAGPIGDQLERRRYRLEHFLVVPEEQLVPFLLLGVAIGVVLGGTQALARSYFSLFIPRGKEAEYFSLYQACERGTSWLGTLVFGLVHQLTDSYRPAIFALIVFFVVGGVLLARVDPERGIREAGNTVPTVV